MNRVTDQQIVQTVAEHWVLSIRQIKALLFKSAAVARRRLLRTSNQNLTRLSEGVLTGKHGRPERLVSLGPEAENINVLPAKAMALLSKFPPSVPHQLLENWFRIELANQQERFPTLTAAYTTTCLADRTEDRHQAQSASRTKPWSRLIPDGYLTLTSKTYRKSLLFFLEVDLSSEPLASSANNSIANKIKNYRQMMARKSYGNYSINAPFTCKGFRVLVLTDTPQRSHQISRLVKQMPPSDFVWITDQDSLLSKGVHARIWIRGGHSDAARESILGNHFKEISQ